MKKHATLTLEIRSIGSPDVDFYSWDPAVDEAYFLVEMEIGQKDVEGADLFQVVIATPEALRKKARGIAISERSTIVVSDYDWPAIEGILRNIVLKCAAENWVASVLRLQQYFQWEYEDYQMEE